MFCSKTWTKDSELLPGWAVVDYAPLQSMHISRVTIKQLATNNQNFTPVQLTDYNWHPIKVPPTSWAQQDTEEDKTPPQVNINTCKTSGMRSHELFLQFVGI